MKNKVYYVALAVLSALAIIFDDVGNNGHFYLAIPPALPLILDGIGYGTQFLSSIFGSIFSGNKQANSQREANNTNLRIAAQTNSSNERIHQQDNAFNRQMAFDMFDRENAYNTPAAQAARLEQAGFNPAVAMGEGAVTAGSADGSTPSAASPIPMIAPSVAPVPNPYGNIFDDIGKFANAFAQMKKANLTGAEKKFILSQTQTEQLKQQQMKIDIAIQAAYGMKQADQNFKNSVRQFEKMDEEINNLIEQGELYKAEKLLKKMQARKVKHEDQLLQDTYQSLVDQEVEKLNNLKKQGKLIDESTNTEKAKQNELNTAADVNIEQKEKTHQETERLKIENRYIDDIDAAAYASSRADTILKLRQAYRSGHALYDGIRDFAHSIMRKLGLDPHNRNFESIEELADEIIKGIKNDNK